LTTFNPPLIRAAFFAAAPLALHGWGRYTRDLIEALSVQGVAVTLITARDAPADPDLPLASYHRLLPSLTPPRRFSTLRQFLALPAVGRAVKGCDLVHVVAEPYTLAAGFLRQPLVVTAHGTYLPQTAGGRWVGAIYRHAYRRAQIICVSRHTERHVHMAIPTAQTVVITNGIDAARLHVPSASHFDDEQPVIITLGQVKARKGLHVLIAAMPAIRAVIPNVRALIIGNDRADVGYTQSLHRQIAELGLADHVRLMGRMDDSAVAETMQKAAVFALPAVSIGNQFEGFGLVYLEASAAGLPVIGTQNNGAEDAIRDGETGFLIPQNDPDALAQAAIRLLRDSALRQKMGGAGRTFAETMTWDKAAARVRAVYTEVLLSHRAEGAHWASA